MQNTCRDPRMFLRPNRCTLLVIGVTVLSAFAVLPARAQTFTTLYSFKGGTDGAYSFSTLIRDAAGNLYGTTQAGGNARDGGTVFKIDTTGNETVLRAFTGYPSDGEYPYAGLAGSPAGNGYGTTFEGGSGCYSYGCGVVYEVDSAGKESVLYSFSGGSDGGNPQGGSLLDSQDNLYGTTVNGGSGCPFLGCGVVFMVSPAGQETVLYSFQGVDGDGAHPTGELLRDAKGNLYGTTTSGGAGYGVVFKVDTSGNETVLYSFTGGSDGAIPVGGLIQDAAGNLYETTAEGGGDKCDAGYGCGVIFKLDTAGNETVLHTFRGIPDGAEPGYGSLIRDEKGNLYGTTMQGGSAYCDAPNGCGILFGLNTAGKLAILHTFTGLSDGAVPQGGLIRDASGNLYGTTYQGGVPSCDCGVVYKISP